MDDSLFYEFSTNDLKFFKGFLPVYFRYFDFLGITNEIGLVTTKVQVYGEARYMKWTAWRRKYE